MQLFRNLSDAIIHYKNENAFFIKETYYTYHDFAKSISKIRHSIQNAIGEDEKNVGLVLKDDLETYATIFALWFEGKAYVPLNPTSPKERNFDVIEQADIHTLIDSSESPIYPDFNTIQSSKLEETAIDLSPKETDDSEIAYIFFTSGTTGKPKGVPIMRSNVSSFMDAFWDLGIKMDKSDRVLQMFEMTFDLSVVSYLAPLFVGACVYPIPDDKIKYNYIFELMDEHGLTFSLMVPSILHYLRPYFDEIDAPSMKYSMFCGEALPLDVTEEWSKCLPNARIMNVYGPTENTIYCTNYDYQRENKNKEHNGILCCGKDMLGVETVIIDENKNILPKGEKGELCLSGKLLTPGYWKNDEKNKEAFFDAEYKGKTTRFYKTGDLCVKDEEDDIMYLGRIDFQTQIQGYRVELSEVEFHVKGSLDKINAVAVAFTNKIGNTEIGLVIESDEIDTTELFNYMGKKLPSYMIPTQTKFVKSFPLNVNGKTDRKKLTQIF